MGKSLFGSKNKTKSSNNPWAPFGDYMTGDSGNLPADANSLYQQSGFSPDMQNANDLYSNYVMGNATDPRYGQFGNAGFDLLQGAYNTANGQYDTSLNPVSSVNMNVERGNLGALDPSNALAKMLSGRPDNPYLDQTANSITGQLTRNMQQNILPQLRSNAIISGQYGGSRQGIAEANAISNLNQDLAPALTNMYSGAYENAQNRMAGAADSLNNQAYNTAFGNANLGLQNNQQALQTNTQNLTNRNQAIPMAQSGFGLLQGLNDKYGSDYQNYINSAMMPQNVNWQNMNNYANLMFNGARLGGTGTNTQTQSPGLIPSILGTAAGAAGIASGFGGLGGMGGIFGGMSRLGGNAPITSLT